MKAGMLLYEFRELISLILGAFIGAAFEIVRNKDNPKGKRLGSTIVIFVAAIAFGLILGYGNSHVTVPDIKGITYEQAKAYLDNSGLSYTEDNGRYGDVVVTYDPANAVVKKGTTIMLTMGRPDPEVEVIERALPDVINTQYISAMSTLSVSGFSNIKVVEEETSKTVAGYVQRMEPVPGTMTKLDEQITLYVSKH